MSIIVKGMKMPENCRECRFQDFGSTTGDTWCGVNDVVLAKNFEAIRFDRKPEWCPLVELTDTHGRLVDAMPTIEPERKKGKWIDNHTTCSECGWQMIDDVIESPNMVAFNFCPNCGAEMEK